MKFWEAESSLVDDQNLTRGNELSRRVRSHLSWLSHVLLIPARVFFVNKISMTCISAIVLL